MWKFTYTSLYTVSSKSIGRVTHFLLFWLCAPTLWIWNDTMTMRLKCRLSSFIRGYFHPHRVNHLEIIALSVHSPFISGYQKYWDKFTYMCIKVVKSWVFGPIFIPRTQWWHQACDSTFAICFGCFRLFYFVFQIIWENNVLCHFGVTLIVNKNRMFLKTSTLMWMLPILWIILNELLIMMTHKYHTSKTC
jgi:hypothetical protein